MALLEHVYKKIVKLGLLPKLIRSLPILPILLTVIGLVWIAVLPDEGQYRRTYISENALMPSQAYSYFRESEWNIVRGYREEIAKFDHSQIKTNLKTMGKWIEDYGFKVHLHESSEQHGDTLYAVWSVPKGDDTEAMVLGASYFNSEGQFNIGGLSLTLALGRYFHRWDVWSKNIILVIPENPNLALRDWVNAYHRDLDLTGGSIEAAMMLDYASDSDNFDYVELYYEGMNGQLPNLDYINVAVSISEHEGAKVSLHGTTKEQLEVNDYWSRLRILLNSIKELAFAGIRTPKGNEPYSGYRIQALTLKAIGKEGGNDITTFGRIPEAVFRSVNNLLEKFHQSFFFYLMLAPRLFISIGTYLPSAGLFAAGFLMSSFDRVLNSGFEINHLLKFVPVVSLYFAGIIGVALFVSLSVPSLPYECSYLLPVISSIIAVGTSFIKLKTPHHREYRVLLHSIAMLYYTIILGSLLVLNFALTFITGLFAIPLCYVKTYTLLSSQRIINVVLNTVLLLISNPFIISLVLALEFQGSVGEFYKGLIDSWCYLDSHTWGVVVLGWGVSWGAIALSLMLHDIEGDDSSTDNKKQK